MTLTVPVDDIEIALAKRGTPRNPVSLALSLAIFGTHARTIVLCKGPCTKPQSRDISIMPAHMDDTTTWFLYWPTPTDEDTRKGVDVQRKGVDVRLPHQAQIFLRVWEAGPSGGALFAIRNDAGQVVARCSFCEIVVPFSFVLDVPDVLYPQTAYPHVLYPHTAMQEAT